MPVRPVLALPHEKLQLVSTAVDEIGEGEKALATDLVDTMRASPGCVGLAAPQIGVNKRAFCMDVTGHKKAQTQSGLVVIFNPLVLSREGELKAREGCMSVPDLTGDVTRSEFVVLEGLDVDGCKFTVKTDAFEARAVQHELDHLDGLLFLDRVGSAGGIFPRKTYL